MVRHPLKTISFVKIDCRRLCVYHEADTSNLAGNARHSVYRIEEHKFPDSLALMAFGGRQSTKPENGHLGGQLLLILGRQVGIDQLSQADRIITKHFGARFISDNHEG